MPKPDWQLIFGLDTDRHRIGRSLMVRGMGLVYLIAIASWWSQVVLLVGEDGLVPASRVLDWVGERSREAGKIPFFSLPSLHWWVGTSNFAFHTTCWVGCVLALLVIFGRFTGPCLAVLWVLYLSLVNTGNVFMSFQWDILLLEAGFLSLFLARWRCKDSWHNPPALDVVNRIALVWSWFLIAKLMFFSGWVKLAWASDASPEWWPDGTAMTFHYMTQPIPTWTAWWAHQLPEWFHKASLVPMYFIELALPFAMIFGRWGRLLAAFGFILLMGLILLSGNYTYFNWLAIVLCLPLIQDKLWPATFRKFLKFQPLGLTPPPARKPLILKLAFAGPVFVVAALLNLHIVLRDLHHAPKPMVKGNPIPTWLGKFASACEPFRLASGYGLFRTMTTERPEILVEGSRDGSEWYAYDFSWKVDDIANRPKFVAPHQPRVAWQFWFAALEGRFDYRSSNAGWIEGLVLKLLRGDPGVRPLLKTDPFPDDPPKFVRARLLRYEFTTREERRESGHWWKRSVIGEYLPPVSRPPDSSP